MCHMATISKHKVSYLPKALYLITFIHQSNSSIIVHANILCVFDSLCLSLFLLLYTPWACTNKWYQSPVSRQAKRVHLTLAPPFLHSSSSRHFVRSRHSRVAHLNPISSKSRQSGRSFPTPCPPQWAELSHSGPLSPPSPLAGQI